MPDFTPEPLYHQGFIAQLIYRTTVLVPFSASFSGGISSVKASFQDQDALCARASVARRPNALTGLCTQMYKCFLGSPLNIFMNPTTGSDTSEIKQSAGVS